MMSASKKTLKSEAMSKAVVINLGKNGNLARGCPNVTAQLQVGGESSEFVGRLPPAPELIELYRTWQSIYRALCRRLDISSRSREDSNGIEIEEGRTINVSVVEFNEICQQLENKLNTWLKSPGFLNPVQKLRSKLGQENTIRVIIKTDDDGLRRLPWHCWDFFNDYPFSEMALSPIEHEPPLTSQPERLSNRVRILAILLKSSDIDIEAERNFLQSLPDAETKFLVNPSRQQFDRMLWETKGWDILFFAGHSRTERETGRIYINENATNNSLTIEELKEALKAAIEKGLKLAIFNSCDGLGLASALEKLHLPCAIVMREPVPNFVAQEFFRHFLAGFALDRLPLYQSVRLARRKLQGLEDDYPGASWLPAICQNPAESAPTWEALRGNMQRDRQPLLPPKPKLSTVFLASAIATSLLLGMRWFGILQPLELWAYDQLMRLRPAEKPGLDERILVVTIDEQDIAYQENRGMKKQGSLSDAALAQMLNQLEKLNPSVIGLDIYHAHPFSGALRTRVGQKDYPFYVTCKVKTDKEGGERPPSPRDIPQEFWGFSDVLTDDAKDTVRRQLLSLKPALTDPCSTDLSFNFLIALHYLDRMQKGIKVEYLKKQGWKIGSLVLPQLSDHTSGYQGLDSQGSQVMLNYRSYSSPQEIARQISLRGVLQGGISAALVNQLQQPIILIGVTARGENYDDFFNTPYGKEIPGVFLQAQAISQIISAVLDKRPLIWWWPWPVEAAWIGGWSVLGGMLAWGFQGTLRRRLSIGIALASLGGICLIIFTQAGWIPLVPPALALVATAVGVRWWSTSHLIAEGRR